MLPAQHRLRKSSEIERVWKRGRSFYTSFLQIKALATNRNLTRCTVVVGTKVSKRAVVRNRIKRRLREILRLHISEIAPGFDLVVYAKKDAATASYASLEAAALAALAGLRLRRNA